MIDTIQTEILQNSTKAFTNLLVSNTALINIIDNSTELSKTGKYIMYQKIKCWTRYAVCLFNIVSKCDTQSTTDITQLADPYSLHHKILTILEIHDISSEYLRTWANLHEISVFDPVIQYIKKELVAVKYVPNILMLIKHLLNETLLELQELDYIFYTQKKEYDIILYVSDFCKKVEEFIGVSPVKERYLIYKQLLNNNVKKVKVFKYVDDVCTISDNNVKFEVENFLTQPQT